MYRTNYRICCSEYTISSVVNKGTDIMFMNFHVLDARDASFKMFYHYLVTVPILTGYQLVANIKDDLEKKIHNNFFANKNQTDVIAKGKQHSGVLEFVNEKVLVDEDNDF